MARPKQVIGNFTSGRGYKPLDMSAEQTTNRKRFYKYDRLMVVMLQRANSHQKPFGGV